MTELEKAKKRALEAYEATMCGGAGCCGDIDAALQIMGEFAEDCRLGLVEDEGE